jgi:hypothetical protein
METFSSFSEEVRERVVPLSELGEDRGYNFLPARNFMMWYLVAQELVAGQLYVSAVYLMICV